MLSKISSCPRSRSSMAETQHESCKQSFDMSPHTWSTATTIASAGSVTEGGTDPGNCHAGHATDAPGEDCPHSAQGLHYPGRGGLASRAHSTDRGPANGCPAITPSLPHRRLSTRGRDIRSGTSPESLADGGGVQEVVDQLADDEVVDEVWEIGRDKGVTQGLHHTLLLTAQLGKKGRES